MLALRKNGNMCEYLTPTLQIIGSKAYICTYYYYIFIIIYCYTLYTLYIYYYKLVCTIYNLRLQNLPNECRSPASIRNVPLDVIRY